jgi:GntR family transcriptional regulator/MocR family aminotransferase
LKEFRETIAAYLRTARAVRCDAEQILVVSGSQQALEISARALLDPGSRVWVEDPGYVFLRCGLTMTGCQLVPVPVDDEGMQVSEGIKVCPNARAAFVTPSHQFPLGVTMSASRRLQLLEWAQRSGAWIIEDDYDSEYRYETMPIASLQGLDRHARVIYIGTFSKTLFPSLRLGYIVMPPDLVQRFTAIRFAIDLCPPHIYQAVLADFINEGHYARHIRKTRLLYGERRSALISALKAELDFPVDVQGAEAGMHIVMKPKKLIQDEEIARRAAGQKLWLWPLSTCCINKPASQGFILGFAATEPKEMREAVRRLRTLVPP